MSGVGSEHHSNGLHSGTRRTDVGTVGLVGQRARGHLQTARDNGVSPLEFALGKPLCEIGEGAREFGYKVEDQEALHAAER